jgi:hypothetical protein
MEIFRVRNKAHLGCWIVASDADTAKQIALERGHARKLENLTTTCVTQLILEEELTRDSALEIVNGDKTGIMIRQMSSYTFTEVVCGTKKPGPRWVLVP